MAEQGGGKLKGIKRAESALMGDVVQEHGRHVFDSRVNRNLVEHFEVAIKQTEHRNRLGCLNLFHADAPQKGRMELCAGDVGNGQNQIMRMGVQKRQQAVRTGFIVIQLDDGTGVQKDVHRSSLSRLTSSARFP